MLRFPPLPLALASFAALASAALGGDFEFAEALAAAGYFDLAEREFHVDLGHRREALDQFRTLYPGNEEHAETVHSMAGLLREIGLDGSTDQDLFARVHEIGRLEEAGVLDRFRDDPRKLEGDVANRLIECRSFLSRSKGEGGWPESRQAQHEEIEKMARSDPSGYAGWLGGEYDKAIQAKYEMLRPYVDQEPQEQQKILRQLALDLAVRLYSTIVRLTPTDHAPPSGIAQEPFLSGSAFKSNMPFPTNREWWEAKHRLLECHHVLEQRAMKITLATNLQQVRLPRKEALPQLRAKLEELRQAAEEPSDAARRETLRQVADFYGDYVEMLDEYSARIDRLAAD